MKYKDVEKAAEKNGLRIRQGERHGIVYGGAGRGYMAYPRHPKEYGKGLEGKIRKWFAALGIVISLSGIFFFSFQLLAYYGV